MNLDRIEKKLNYEFVDKGLLVTALTHSSFVREMSKNKLQDKSIEDNERLEFLGDAFLDAIVGKELYSKLNSRAEGDLTKLRAQVVCESSLVIIAKNLGLGDEMFFGKGEEKSGGSRKPSILADALEAIIGAIVLDGGYKAAEFFVLKNFDALIKKVIKGDFFADYKSKVQELIQAREKGADIKYVLDSDEGPPHNKTFYMHLEINGIKMGSGIGKSKKEAQQMAAKKTLEMENSHNVF